ncbi:MAG: 1,4-alpha-glucan branching protein GlgB [Verrucomicrobia bacterium]|nr:1,4-alpha-glucan branching protein GlgB [Verrucomicrobiota bacterium]
MQGTVSLEDEVEWLSQGRHTNPHRFLGLHKISEEEKVIRLWAPLKRDLLFEYRGEIVRPRLVHEAGLFVYHVPLETEKTDYRVIHPNGVIGFDPYSFAPLFSPVDSHLFNEGVHYRLYEVLGAHIREVDGVEGVHFALWAPNATRVSLIADCNYWKEHVTPMRKIEESGVFEIFMPGIKPGMKYKFAIRNRDGHSSFKTDLFANAFELRPQTAAIVASNHEEFCFRDGEWLEERKRSCRLDLPINVYEVHLSSWRKKKGQFYNYRELASLLVPYLKDMGYTHVEILPVTEHPLDESWGYQTTGYFAPTSRHGNMEDFQYFVNHLHMHHIGVIFDWSPGHFPRDSFALAYYDGTAQFERDHHVMGSHPQWGTSIYDYGNKKVSNFLIASVLFWLEKMHVDAIRVDAVQSMLFLDYGREWSYFEPNRHGGKENLDAIEFLKHLNSIVHQNFPGVLMIAEDASIYTGITKPLEWGGLGFDLKWNIGWMHDTLKFITKDPIYRKYHHEDLLKSYELVLQERYVLPISHDEVVHGKKSLLQKMPGDHYLQFAHMRLYYSAAFCHPGKKLFFMGVEIGQRNEWWSAEELHWHHLEDHMHIKWKKFVRDVNHFYLKHPSLWQIDFHRKGFAWIDNRDDTNSVISFFRRGVEEELICVHNFTPTHYAEYIIKLEGLKEITELFNSDEEKYGGCGNTNRSIRILEDGSGFVIKMPPLATMIFKGAFV